MKNLAGLTVALIAGVMFLHGAETTEPVDVLARAHEMGGKLKTDGFVYPKAGLPAGTKTIDCTQFVLRLVESLVPNLASKAKVRIAISDLDGEDVASNKEGIVTRGDERTKGVQQALVDLQRGEVVQNASAKAGDLVQYWMRQSDGKWFGHAGIIERVDGKGEQVRAWMYGSHKSKNGIGTAPDDGLRLVAAEDRRIYIVRFK